MPVDFSGMTSDQIPQEYHDAAAKLGDLLIGHGDRDVNGVGIGADGLIIYLLRDGKAIRAEVDKVAAEHTPGIEYKIQFMGRITAGCSIDPIHPDDEDSNDDYDDDISNTQLRWDSIV